MDSDLARFLLLKLRDLLLESMQSQPLPYSMLIELDTVDILNEVISSLLTSPESIRFLYLLNDLLSHWLIHKKQKTKINDIFSIFGPVRRTDIRKLRFLIDRRMVYESPGKRQLNFDLDRFTFYEPGPIIHNTTAVFPEHQEKIVGWLSASGGDDQGFKAVGIYGIGGSGKTTLVKQVLKNPKVADKFKDNNIIWACLSHLTSSEEVDIRIVKYILNYLNYDLDDLTDEKDEDEAWLMNQLKHQLDQLGSYVIVLDDLWHCSKWIAGFYRRLAKDSTVGTVILISRKRQVVEEIMFGKKKKDNKGCMVIHIDPWDYMNNGHFLKDIVGENKNLVEYAGHDKEEIIRHCHGLVLAANHLPQLPPRHSDEFREEISAGEKNKAGSKIKSHGVSRITSLWPPSRTQH